VSLDATGVSGNRARLLGGVGARQQAAQADIREVQVAQLAHDDGVPLGVFCARRIHAACHFAQQPPRLIAGGVRNPRGAMAADRVPALSACLRAEEDEVADRVALLPPRAEPGDDRVPKDFARSELRNITMSNTSLRAHGTPPG
jgi:hypothetical protein